MAEFNRDLQNLKPSFSEMNSSSSNLLDISNNYQTALTDNYDHQQILAFSNHQQQPHPHLPINFANNFQSLFNVSASSSSSSPSAVSGTGLSLNENIKSFGRRKRKRKDEDMEKPKDVIHVRAKRGQATDSHSLAERARREKINEKLRCLQDLVPGCYKAMGMAVMLDVIINYVHSLQNQIEFLSSKLSAASMHYDFNLERDDMETVQATNAYELQEMETMEREGYGGPSNYFHTQLGSFD